MKLANQQKEPAMHKTGEEVILEALKKIWETWPELYLGGVGLAVYAGAFACMML